MRYRVQIVELEHILLLKNIMMSIMMSPATPSDMNLSGHERSLITHTSGRLRVIARLTLTGSHIVGIPATS